MNAQSDQIIEELRQCTSLESLLLDELQELLDEAVDEEETRWIESTLNELCELFEREFQLQSAGGYLQEVVDEFPSREFQVQSLRLENERLLQELRQLSAGFHRLALSKRIPRDVRDQVRRWIERYARHRRAERNLVLESMNVDVGIGE